MSFGNEIWTQFFKLQINLSSFATCFLAVACLSSRSLHFSSGAYKARVYKLKRFKWQSQVEGSLEPTSWEPCQWEPLVSPLCQGCGVWPSPRCLLDKDLMVLHGEKVMTKSPPWLPLWQLKYWPWHYSLYYLAIQDPFYVTTNNGPVRPPSLEIPSLSGQFLGTLVGCWLTGWLPHVEGKKRWKKEADHTRPAVANQSKRTSVSFVWDSCKTRGCLHPPAKPWKLTQRP